MLDDDSAELVFWDGDIDQLCDHHGRIVPAPPAVFGRSQRWFHGVDGVRLALLIADAPLVEDAGTVQSIGRLVMVLAHELRLQSRLRSRISQLQIFQAMQRFAFDQARERFHHILYDGVQQTIAAARMDLEGFVEAAGGDAVDDLLNSVRRRLDVALDQVRGLEQVCDPIELRTGLQAAVAQVARALDSDTEVSVTSKDLGQLAVLVHYVIREALTDIHKHADTTRVEIEVVALDNKLAISMHDDGVAGIHVCSYGGMEAIRRRVADLGGSFVLESPPGDGSRLTVTIPTTW